MAESKKPALMISSQPCVPYTRQHVPGGKHEWWPFGEGEHKDRKRADQVVLTAGGCSWGRGNRGDDWEGVSISPPSHRDPQPTYTLKSLCPLLESNYNAISKKMAMRSDVGPSSSRSHIVNHRSSASFATGHIDARCLNVCSVSDLQPHLFSIPSPCHIFASSTLK